MTTAADVQTPANVQLPPIDARAVARAARHFKLALDSEGFPGAMIYSQNCYESLKQSFSWAKLDQCEAFDGLSQLAISQGGQTGTEVAYFDKGAVQARFTNAAANQHGDAAGAQTHLSELMVAALAKIADLQDESSTAALAAAGSDYTSADSNNATTAPGTAVPEGGDTNQLSGANESE